MLGDGVSQRTVAERLGLICRTTMYTIPRDRKIQKKTWARTWEGHNSMSGSLSPEHGML